MANVSISVLTFHLNLISNKEKEKFKPSLRGNELGATEKEGN